MYVLSSRTVSALTQVLFLCLFPLLLITTREINTKNNPLISAETVRHSNTYIILYICNAQYWKMNRQNKK